MLKLLKILYRYLFLNLIRKLDVFVFLIFYAYIKLEKKKVLKPKPQKTI